MWPLRTMVSALHIGFTHLPSTQLPSAAHAVPHPPQLAWSACVSTHVVPQSMPVMHMQVPFMHVCPVPHVTVAQGSTTLPPAPEAAPTPAVPPALIPAVPPAPAPAPEPPVPPAAAALPAPPPVA